MRKTVTLMAGAAAIALLSSPVYAKAQSSGTSQPAPAPAAASDSRVDELEARIDALEAELQAAEMRQAADHNKVASWKPMKGWWDDTKISGRMYYNITNIDNSRVSGTSSDTNGFSFDIKRFYVGIDHKFNSIFSANVTTDFTYDSGVSTSQVYIKKAYLQAALDPAFTLRIGAADMAWVPFAEGAYGFRWVENTIADRTKFGTSSDWGVHALGKLPGGIFSYQVSVISGVGYKKAGSTSFRSEQPDIEGRLSADYKGFTVAVGGYWGHLGATKGNTVYHDATRFNALVAYKIDGLRVGVEGFTAENWFNVKSSASSSGWGVSPFASYQFNKEWGVFGRYDFVDPYTDGSKKYVKDHYFNVGLVYSPTKIVDFALVYKRDAIDNGYMSTSNGTIGGSSYGYGHDGTYDEVGIFGRLRW